MTNPTNPHGSFCWNELVTRDLDAANAFYSELLGWKAAEMGGPMKYLIIKNNGKDTGGMMSMPPDVGPQVPSHWMAYIAVDDVDARAAKATELGAEMIHTPHDIPGVGRFCILKDPTGAVVALITLKS